MGLSQASIVQGGCKTLEMCGEECQGIKFKNEMGDLSCWSVGNSGIASLWYSRSEDCLNSCCTAMKQMAAQRKWTAFTWKESWWAGLPLHGEDWQPAQSQTVWECCINTRSEKLGTSELEFGASDEKMHVGETCSLF